MNMTRREARSEVLSLVFEYAFKPKETPEQIWDSAVEIRNLPDEEFVKSSFLGVIGNLVDIDGLIEKHSNGWKVSRISPVALAIMRLAVYEMKYCDDIPSKVALNEAIELVKIYDDADKVRPFVNGILNAVMKDLSEV